MQTDKQIACNEQTYLDVSKCNNEMALFILWSGVLEWSIGVESNFGVENNLVSFIIKYNRTCVKVKIQLIDRFSLSKL